MKDSQITLQERKVELLKSLKSKKKAEKSSKEGVRSMIENSSKLRNELSLRIAVLDLKGHTGTGADRKSISRDMFAKIAAKCNSIQAKKLDAIIEFELAAYNEYGTGTITATEMRKTTKVIPLP